MNKNCQNLFIVSVMSLMLIVCLINCDSSNNNGYGDFQYIVPGLNESDIPFKLIFPTYLPESIDKRPGLEGIWPDSRSEGTADIDIEYISNSGNVEVGITIGESNYPGWQLPDPTDDPEYRKYIELNGVQIVQAAQSMQIFGSDGSSYFVTGPSYHWIHDDIYFNVVIYGYEDNEAVKAIESMIQ